MKHWLPLIVVLAIWAVGFVVAFAQDRPVSQAFYFNTITSASGGTFGNADSAPTWTLLKNGSTVITTGTFTVVGTGTLAGDYYGSLTLNSASFATNDTYAIEATGTISAVPVKTIVAQGFALPAQIVTGEPLAYAAGGTITTATNLTTNNDKGGYGVATLVSGTGANQISLTGGRVLAGGGTIDNAGSILGNVAGTVTGINGGTINVTGIVNSGTFSNTGTLSAGTVAITNSWNAGSMSTGTMVVSSQLTLNAVRVSVSSGDAIAVTVAGGNGNAISLTGAGTGAGLASTGIVNAGSFSTGSLTSSGVLTFGSISIPGGVTSAQFTTGTASFGTLGLLNASNLSLLTVGTITNYTGNTVQTGDSFARLGAPSGASIDADILSRLATSGYTSPPTVTQIRSEMDSNSTKLANLDAAISTRMATFTLPTRFSSLSIDASGNITVGGYATGFSPADLTLATPANKLATDANGAVTVRGAH